MDGQRLAVAGLLPMGKSYPGINDCGTEVEAFGNYDAIGGLWAEPVSGMSCGRFAESNSFLSSTVKWFELSRTAQDGQKSVLTLPLRWFIGKKMTESVDGSNQRNIALAHRVMHVCL